MLAFGHDISAPFLEKVNNLSALPQLSVIQTPHSPVALSQKLTFNQNQGRDVLLCTDLNFYENLPQQNWAFEVVDVVSFYWCNGANIIYYHEHTNGTATLSKYWFLHTLLPMFMSIEDKYELIHAGAVEIDNQAVLFIAPSYGGKSTLTNHFINQGHTMISDDKVALHLQGSEIMATASYPYHRPYRKMEDLGKRVSSFMLNSKKLHSIYLLSNTDPDEETSFHQLKGLDSFKALQYNFDFNLPLNKARTFELTANIASKVPIYQLNVPWDINKLDDVYQALCQHINHKERQ